MRRRYIALLLCGCATFAQAQLHSRIQRIAEQAHGRVGVACSLPGVKLDCDFNADAHLPMQSVYKFPIALATLHAVEEGRLSLTQVVRFLPSDRISLDQHSPLQAKYPDGNADVFVAELLRLAVEESDGAASDMLLRVLGGADAVDAYIKSLGVDGIRILDTEQTLGRDDRAQYRNYAEPRALVQLLRMVADSSPLTKEHTLQLLLLQWMTEAQTGPHRIKGLLPRGTVVAHKTGSSGQDKSGNAAATNDVALITLPNGKKLSIAIMVSDSRESEQVREAVIAQIAKAVWDEAVRAGATTRP